MLEVFNYFKLFYPPVVALTIIVIVQFLAKSRAENGDDVTSSAVSHAKASGMEQIYGEIVVEDGSDHFINKIRANSLSPPDRLDTHQSTKGKATSFNYAQNASSIENKIQLISDSVERKADTVLHSKNISSAEHDSSINSYPYHAQIANEFFDLEN